MSKNNNANHGSYQTEGREPHGQGIAHDVADQQFGKEKAKEKEEAVTTTTPGGAPLKKGMPEPKK